MKAAVVLAAVFFGGCSVPGMPGMESAGGSATGAAGAADGKGSKVVASSGELPDGIPGAVCDHEGRDFMHTDYGYDGPCWDPPGMRETSRMPSAAIRGRRAVPPVGVDQDGELWWFEMPEAEVRNTGCPDLVGANPEFRHPYEPYEEGGFAPFSIGDLTGVPLAEVLDRIDALDKPACVTVKFDTQCDDGHGKVCFQSLRPGDPVESTGALQLIVGSDVRDAGTPDEQRRLPALVDRKLDEVLADLAARGFTKVEVVEANVSCERGVVCEATPDDGFHGPGEVVQLTVRRGTQQR